MTYSINSINSIQLRNAENGRSRPFAISPSQEGGLKQDLASDFNLLIQQIPFRSALQNLFDKNSPQLHLYFSVNGNNLQIINTDTGKAIVIERTNPLASNTNEIIEGIFRKAHGSLQRSSSPSQPSPPSPQITILPSIEREPPLKKEPKERKIRVDSPVSPALGHPPKFFPPTPINPNSFLPASPLPPIRPITAESDDDDSYQPFLSFPRTLQQHPAPQPQKQPTPLSTSAPKLEQPKQQLKIVNPKQREYEERFKNLFGMPGATQPIRTSPLPKANFSLDNPQSSRELEHFKRAHVAKKNNHKKTHPAFKAPQNNNVASDDPQSPKILILEN